MMANGLRGFTQTEVRLDIDFAASDLFLDPATLQGPNVDRALASVNIDGVVRNAAETQYEGVSRLLSDAAWLRVREAIKADPSILTRPEPFWLPASHHIDVAPKGEGAPAAEDAYDRLQAADAATTGLNGSP